MKSGEVPLKKIILFGLLAIFVTYLYAYGSLALYEKRLPSFLGIWHKWDTLSYIAIAQKGYEIEGDNKVRIVFPPFYPFLIKIFSFFLKDYILSSLVVSNLSYILALIFLYKLVTTDLSEKIGLKAIFYFTIFPTAYFLHAGYTESLFLFLSIASFYFARKKKWLISSSLASLAVLTRLPGILLFPSLLIEYLNQNNFKFQGIKKEIILLGLIPFAFFVYLFLNYQLFGNPFQFLIFEKEYWSKSLIWPHKGIAGLIDRIKYMQANLIATTDLNEKIHLLTLGWFELLFLILAFALILFFSNQMRPSYFFYSLGNLLLISSTTFCLSAPRYVLVLFPIFIALGFFGQGKNIHFLTSSVFLILHGLFLYRFALGFWAF